MGAAALQQIKGLSLAAFRANQAINASLTALPLLTPDQMFRSTGNGVIVPAWANFVCGIFTRGATMTRAQLTSPTLRRQGVNAVEIRPFATAIDTAGQKTRWQNLLQNPLRVGPNEELDILITNTAQDQETVGVLFSDAPVTPLKTQTMAFPALFTGSTTLTANAWSLVTLTSDQQLPPGTYDIVGFRAKSAGAVLARLVFADQNNRPGCVCVQADGTSGPSEFDYGSADGGMCGVLGTFVQNALPNVEFLSDSADTSENVIMWLVPHLTQGVS